MTEQEKWNYIIKLDEELLHGGVILSEFTTFLAKDSETAFCKGAHLASILTSQAAIESHLRYDYFSDDDAKKWGFYQLIENSDLPIDLKRDLHELRKFRNKWVHVKEPENDFDLLDRPEVHENELFLFAKQTIKVMLRTLYSNPWI